jgi:hypothetical protein
MPATHYATGLQLDQLQVNRKPVARESQVARLAINAAAHYATGLQQATLQTSQIKLSLSLGDWQQACNSILLDHAQFNRKKNRARVHILNLVS